MTEAYIYDAVRTPRGKGKKDGSLHSVTPVDLAAAPLKAIRDRNDLDTTHIDDVVLGCVDPVGEQGGNIGRFAAIHADYAEPVAGVQINRFCASGLEATNMAAAQVMSGQSDLHRRRHREHEPCRHGVFRQSFCNRSAGGIQILLCAARHLSGPHCH